MKIRFLIKLLLLLLSGIPASLHAQEYTIPNDSAKKRFEISGPFNKAEVQLPAVAKQPEFPGGKKVWQDFLRKNINITVPFTHKAAPGIYKVMIRFIVRTDGTLSDIGADSNCGYGMESEVIRCIKKSAAWIPAETSSGTKVRFILRQVVTFTVKPYDVVVSFS